MNHIVNRLLKVDFHIHSCHSSSKDGDKVKGGTKENLHILISKLKEKRIDMCAITDHNCFSYDMYCALKKYEENGTLLKVLPGVEFDLYTTREQKDIHVVVLFDDENEKKVGEIEELISNKMQNSNSITEGNLRDLLCEINLNCITIVHQKTAPSSNSQNKSNNRDLGSLGKDRFDEVICADYFDAVEFKSYKTEGFLIGHQNERNVNFKYLCGSDCHVWECYPRYDEVDNEDAVFAYIKSLPTFKGLAMAVTGEDRIATVDIKLEEPFLKELRFLLYGEEKVITLSRGLNVIIGDNSIGKSFLLESIDDDDFKNSKKSSSYKIYKKRLSFQILNRDDINLSIIKYLRQGDIREMFEGNKSIENEQFLNSFFKEINFSNEKSAVENFIDKFIANRESYSNLIAKEKELSSTSLLLKPEFNRKTHNLLLTESEDTLSLKDYLELIQKIDSAKTALDNLYQHEDLEEKDKELLKKQINEILTLKTKYEDLKKRNDFEKKIYSAIVTGFKSVKKAKEERKTTIDGEIKKYLEEKNALIKLIKDSFRAGYVFARNQFDINSFKTIEIKPIEEQVAQYKFISSLKNGVITKNDIEKALIEPIGYVDKFSSIKDLSADDLYGKMKSSYLNNSDFASNKEKYKAGCMEYILENHLQPEKGKIIPIYASSINGNSLGLNAQYYLDVYADRGDGKIIIIDQPEDDVSEMRISNELLPIMKRMANKKQVIFVTHNPELVVNLDVDNVIVLKSDNNDRVNIFNGALEFEDKVNNVVILDEIATLLDGGAEVIRKRWKRYAKR